MTRTFLRYRNASLVVASLLVAGCSGTSPRLNEGSGAGSSGGNASGGTSSSGGNASSGSGSSSGGDTDGTDSGGAGSSSGSMGGDDGGEGVPDSGGRGTRDAGARDASTGDAGIVVVGDGGDALAAARAQCVQIINADRATLMPASPPLQEDAAEEACVDGQAKADYTANTAHSAFGNCKEHAQDECPNWPGPPSSIMTKCLAQMWAEGPPAAGVDNHWLNMSNAKYKKVACGFYQTPSGKWWATQDFY